MTHVGPRVVHRHDSVLEERRKTFATSFFLRSITRCLQKLYIIRLLLRMVATVVRVTVTSIIQIEANHTDQRNDVTLGTWKRL